MEKYIGTKVVSAARGHIVNGCIWPNDLPLPEVKEVDAPNAGFDISTPHIEEGYFYDDGTVYARFTRKDEFEKEFRPADRLSFGDAIVAAKQGARIARAGWNGKNQYVELATCISYCNAAGDIVNVDHDAIGNKALAFVGTSGVQMGWLASQADMLADDWQIVE